MKKILILIAVFAGFTASAQELTSKKGTPIRPEVGDFWIGINAVPFLEYAGNMFVTGSNSAPNWGFTAENPGIITGGYVVDANTSYRAKLRLGFGSTTENFGVANDATTTDPNDFSFDERKVSGNNIALGVGIQKNRGNGRLRGLYGAEAMIGLSGGKTTHSFANAYTSTNTTPSTSVELDADGSANGRFTEVKNGSTFDLGINAFVGAEYFFAPKISLSGEFTWGLGLSSTGEGEVTSENWDVTSNGVKSTSTKIGKSSSFGIDTGNVGGAINMNFYF
jgi:hypothetical protein